MKIEIINHKDDKGFYSTYPMRVSEVCSQIWPDFKGDYKIDYHGVTFSAINDGFTSHKSKLLGIALVAGGYQFPTRKRVMVKDGFIDGDVLKAKYEELKVIADKYAASQKASDDLRGQSRDTLEKVMAELGIDRRDSYSKGITSHSPTEVEIRSEYNGVTWQQLKEASELLGKELRVEIKVVVPVEKAIAVYKALRPEKR